MSIYDPVKSKYLNDSLSLLIFLNVFLLTTFESDIQSHSIIEASWNFSYLHLQGFAIITWNHAYSVYMYVDLYVSIKILSHKNLLLLTS